MEIFTTNSAAQIRRLKFWSWRIIVGQTFLSKGEDLSVLIADCIPLTLARWPVLSIFP